jgi:hypothetical protein
MRNIIYIFLVFVLVFFLNLLLYIYVDSYRNFIKTLKYGDDFNSYEAQVDDTYNVNSIEYWNTRSEGERGLLLDLWIEDNDTENIIATNSQTQNIIRPDIVTIEWSSSNIVSETQIWEKEELTSDNINISRELRVTNVSEEILEIFQKSGFELLERTDKDDLLDVAREYPDEYFQYGNNSFELYILATKTYNQVDDMFRLLEEEMPFTRNKTNSFWEQSFFINLDRPDEKVRFIFQYKGEVYWVKVRTPNYNAVKSILNTL